MKRFSLFLFGLIVLFSAPAIAQGAENYDEMVQWRGNNVTKPQYDALNYFDMNPASPGSLILFGSTTLAMVQWAEIFPNAPVRTYAVARATTPFLYRHVAQVIDSRPRRVFILAGEHEAITLEGGARALGLLQKVVEDLRRKAGRTELYVVSLATSGDERTDKAIRSYNSRLQRLAGAYGAQFIDLNKAIEAARADNVTLLARTNGRLGSNGVRILAKLLAPHIGACRICL